MNREKLEAKLKTFDGLLTFVFYDSRFTIHVSRSFTFYLNPVCMYHGTSFFWKPHNLWILSLICSAVKGLISTPLTIFDCMRATISSFDVPDETMRRNLMTGFSSLMFFANSSVDSSPIIESRITVTPSVIPASAIPSCLVLSKYRTLNLPSNSLSAKLTGWVRSLFTQTKIDFFDIPRPLYI